jgi:hypothetical protein
LRHAIPPRLAALATLALLLPACATDPAASAAAPTASPSASPGPSPSPTPAPVKGAVELTSTRLEASGTRLHPRGSAADRPVPVDEQAVRGFVGDVARWLDGHLTSLQTGGPGQIPSSLHPDDHPAAAAAAGDALASPAAPVATARYVTEVAVAGGPRWAHVLVTVRRPDDTTATAAFVFVPGDDGPELVAAGPAGASS